MQLTLPWPPAVNNLFATVKSPKGLRRIPSRGYVAWLALAASALSEQRWEPVAGSVRLHLLLTPPDQRKRDADNYFKAPIDFLVKQGLLRGDDREHVRGVAADWSDAEPKKPGSILISVEAA